MGLTAVGDGLGVALFDSKKGKRDQLRGSQRGVDSHNWNQLLGYLSRRLGWLEKIF